MPDCAAHYLFGQEVLGLLCEELQSCALAYRKEYDTGLQGPDIFFFYRPYRQTEIARYGTARHQEPAIRMFGSILAQPRRDAALSYLLGLICHYTLDACCHPYVGENSADSFDHYRMEAAYGRHRMLQQSIAKPRYLLLHDRGMDFDALASLWPGMSPQIIRTCVRSMRFYTRLLDHKAMIKALETAAGKPGAFSPMSLPDTVSLKQREHARYLDEQYARALTLAPVKIRRACETMGNDPLRLEGFTLNYEGEAAHG